ncbi:MAG TPA: ThiF family adenylyltransferase [Bryobacteraceae bacterium]|nr:ThiF family adenylyltransferase [Bryobacteraceae bacterium]
MNRSATTRYSRQIRFAPFGAEGQERLGRATAVIAGCGALGTVHASLLARAGVGTLRLIDRDYIELSNLQRQVLYTEADAEAELPKAEAARRHLLEVNSDIAIEAHVSDLNASNADELLGAADVILDATDNFETRMLINDFAIRDNIPWIYGAAVSAYGIAMPILPGDSACFRCVYPEPPKGVQPTCETAGVLGPVTSLIASIQAMEAIKILAGRAENVRRKIFTADLWTGPVREISMPARDPECPACAKREFVYLDNRRRAPVSLCGRNAVQIHERQRPLDLTELAARLAGLGQVRANEFALRFHDGEHEITIFPDGRAIIKGTTDPGVARSVYSRYLG